MILITGSTGFLGRELMGRLLVTRPTEQIVVVVRPSSQLSAVARIKHILDDIFGSAHSAKYFSRVNVVSSDITLDSFGLGKSEFSELASKITSIYHCAAVTDLNGELSKARQINVGGTYQVLKLAEQAVQCNPDNFRLNHISTAYVAGSTHDIVNPDRLDLTQAFRNSYELSKAEAEFMVRGLQESIPSSIFRPSIIVGDSITGQTSAFNVIYIPARFLAKGLFRKIPASPHAPFDVVPVDYVADAIVYLSGLDLPSGTCYHLTAGLGRESTPFEIVEHLIATFNKYKNKGRDILQIPPLVAPELFSRFFKIPHTTLTTASITVAKSGIRSLEKIVSERFNILKHIVPFIPYVTSNPRFDNSSTVRDLAGKVEPAPLFTTYAERVFMYCLETNWGKRPWTNPKNLDPWYNRTNRTIVGLN